MEITVYPYPPNQPFINLEVFSEVPWELVELLMGISSEEVDYFSFFQKDNGYKVSVRRLPSWWKTLTAEFTNGITPISGEDTIEIYWHDFQGSNITLRVLSASPKKIVQLLVILPAMKLACEKHSSLYELYCTIYHGRFREIEADLLRLSGQSSL